VNKKTTPAPPGIIIAQLTIQFVQRLGYPLSFRGGMNWSAHSSGWLVSLSHSFTIATLAILQHGSLFLAVFIACYLWLATLLAIVVWASWSFHQNRFTVTWPLQVLSIGAKVSL
jgi:hypothetical protein